jgi:two-component system sensor histidine kinase VicK
MYNRKDLDKGLSKLKSIIARQEFQVVWILFAVVAAAFVLDVVTMPSGFFVYMKGGLLLVVLTLAGATAYQAASVSRDAEVERGELKSMLASIDDALIVYDKGFRVNFFNPAAERLFEIPAGTILGHVLTPQDVERPAWRTFVQIVFPSLAPRVVVRSAEGEYPQVVDVSFANPQLEFRVTTAPINGENGLPFGFMKIVRDRTAQTAVMRSQGEFVTVASHQLRGPVTDINWALQSLVHATELTETNKLIVDNALAASQGLLRRIENLLNIAKMEGGRFGYTFREADIAEFLGKILADVLPAARKAGVKLYFDRPSGSLPRVMVDEEHLSLAIVNILENAIRYNVENGEVTIKVDAIPGRPFLEVSVKDTGIGIPPEAVGKLFTKFYRADNAVKLQTEGSGLGLCITKSIVMAHGGEIWVESELNRGTTVRFTLPTDPSLVPQHEAGMEEFS